MNDAGIPTLILDRLRANLRAAGIAITDADIEGMVEKGLLRNAAAFEELDRRVSRDPLPDYLNRRDPAAQEERVEAGDPEPLGPVLAMQAHKSDGYPSITDIAGSVRNRELSPVELTRESLARIAERDARLNAFQSVLSDQAMAAAREAERE
ncbi:MAG TPA: amidase, partial [Dehalococcoidia bacterium]|nr:amidase [Dehalococcoidia bacterium]